MSLEYSASTPNYSPDNITVGIWSGTGAPFDIIPQYTPPSLTQSPLTVTFDLYNASALASRFVSVSNLTDSVTVSAGDYIAMVIATTATADKTVKFVEASVELI